MITTNITNSRIGFLVAALLVFSIFGVFLSPAAAFNQTNDVWEFGGSPISTSGYSAAWTETWNGSMGDWCQGKAWYNGTSMYVTGYAELATGNALFLVKFNTVTRTTEWASFFDDPNYSEEGNGVWGDGTYIYTVGMTGTETNGNDLLLVKWNSTGGQVWNKTYGSTGYDLGSAVWGNASMIYTAGHITVSGENTDALLVAWDPTSGDVSWAHSWGLPKGDRLNAVVGDGTFLYTTGNSWVSDSGNFEMLLVKWYGNGTVSKNGTIGTIGNNNGDYGVDICLVGGSTITCGTFSNPGGASHNVALVAWDSNCVPIWNATWGVSGYSMNVGSMWKSGNSIFMCGEQRDIYANYVGLLVECTTSGAYVSSKTYGFTDSGLLCGIAGDTSGIYTVGTFLANVTSVDYDLIFIKWTLDPPVTPPGGVSGFSDILVLVSVIVMTPVVILKKNRKHLSRRQ